MVRLVIRLNRTSKIGATLIGIGVLMSVYARMNNGPLPLNQAGVVIFVTGFIVYFAGRAAHYKSRMRVPKDDAEE
ncbi:MAG: hypothetical protein V3T86_02135 [Planctomycetota bacterium]